MIRPNRDFERLDSTLFRAFMAAAKTLNFTRAAQQTAMTQSGISQHIAKLESQIGISLFIRSNKSVLLTAAGKQLVSYIDRYLDGVDTLCEKLQNTESNMEGMVTYAMPGSCLLSPHLSMMLECRKKEYPDIELRILIRTNDEIMQSLLEGVLDFGFVTQKTAITGLKLIPFCCEEFVLVIPNNMSLLKGGMDKILEADFITYPGMDVYFDLWQRYYFPKIKKRCFEALKVKGHIESISGAVALVAGGVGCAIIPRHCVDKELQAKQLLLHYPDKKHKPLLNTIHIAVLEAQKPTRRAKQVMDWFFAMHPEMKH